MSCPMCGPALEPRPKSWQSMSVPESLDETQRVGKKWVRGVLYLSGGG